MSLTLTPVETLACNARLIARWARGDRTLLMSALVAQFSALAGNPIMSCAQLQAAAAAYNCLSPNEQLPALIYLANLIVSAQAVPAGAGYVFGGIGSPNITPTTPWAVWVDNTIPTQQAFWAWNGSAWNELIAS